MKFFLKSLIISLLFFSVRLCAQDTEVFRDIFSGPQVINSGEKMYETLTLAKTLNCKNYAIRAVFKHENGASEKGYGIIFESAGVENSNVFLISASGYFLTGCFSSGTFKSFCNWRKSDYITASETDTLKIVKAGRLTFFYINGHQVYCTSAVKHYGSDYGYIVKKGLKISSDFFDIMTEKEKYVFVSPKRFLWEINSLHSEIAPVESDDGKVLYFSRIGSEENFGLENGDIWAAEKKGDGFLAPVRLPYKPNDSLVNAVIATASNNRTLYIEGVYDSLGNRVSAYGISKTTRLSEHYYSKPENVKIKDFYNQNPHGTYTFSSDFQVLIISAETEDTRGGLDLYVSFLDKNGVYSKPQNLGLPLNTELDDGTPFLSPDGKTLFFSSYGHKGFGSSDIFVSRRLDRSFLKWSEPENLGSSVNSANWDAYFSVSKDLSTAYFVSNDNENLDENIYAILLPEELKRPKDFFLELVVTDAWTGEKIKALVSDKKHHGIVPQFDGVFKVCFGECDFPLTVSADNYLSSKVNFRRKLLTDSTIHLKLLPKKFALANLIFEYRSSVFDPSEKAKKELEHLVKFLKENPSVMIKITGHTEAGRNQSLMNLSHLRANAVKNYLAGEGVDHKRIKTDYKGGLFPISKDQPYKNRRVEIEILH